MREGPGLPLVMACRPGMQGWMDRLKVYGMRFEGLTELTKEFLPPRMFRCLTRTENLGEIIRSGGNRKSNEDTGGNEGLREEEDTDEPEWSGGMVGESVLADMELEARLRGVGEAHSCRVAVFLMQTTVSLRRYNNNTNPFDSEGHARTGLLIASKPHVACMPRNTCR